MKFINLYGLTTAERLVVLENICNNIIAHLNKETLYTTVDEYSSSTLNYDITNLNPKTEVMPESGQLVYFSNGFIGIIGNIDTIGNTYGVSEITDIKGEKGEKGDPGEKGEKGDPGETLTLYRHIIRFSQASVYDGNIIIISGRNIPYDLTTLRVAISEFGCVSGTVPYSASGWYKSSGSEVPIYGVYAAGSTLYLAYPAGNSIITAIRDNFSKVE